MTAASDRERAKQELKARLTGSASPLLIERLVKSLDEWEPTAASTQECVKRIRVAVRMFVDENLAEEIAVMLSKELDHPS